EEPDRERGPRRQDPETPGRGDRFDDAAGAQEPRRPESQPQETHRRRRRRQGRGRQQAAQDAPEHGRHDEGHGFGKTRPDGRNRAGDGFWRRHALARADEGADRKDAGRCRARRDTDAAEGAPRRPAPGPAELAGAYGTEQQADPAGSRRFSRTGEEEVRTFRVDVVILRCEAAFAASLEGWPRVPGSAALRGARQEVARTSG